MKELHELLDQVKDSKTFIIFAKALQDDREPHEDRESDDVGFCGDWANNDIWGFLEAGISWAESSKFGENTEQNIGDNPWKQFATFLYCGKTYE